MSTPSPVPSSSFEPPSHAGFLAGRSRGQTLLAFGLILAIFLPLLAGAQFLSARSAVLAVGVGLALTNVKGASLWQWLAVRLGFAVRRATGRTRWTVSPFAAGSTVGLIDVPGPVGSRILTFDLVATDYRGASFVWDRERGEATAVIRCSSLPFEFQQPETKAARAQGWTAALGEIARLEDVVRVVTQARCLPHLNPRSEAGGNPFVDADVRAVEDGPLRFGVGHDMIVTVTVKAARGTAADVSRQLSERVSAIADLLRDCGVDTENGALWLNAAQIRAQIKCMFDPAAASALDGDELPDDMPISSSWDEETDRVHVDRMWARTMWVDRLPSEPQSAGWLLSLVDNGRYSLVLTQIWTPISPEAATKRLNNRREELRRKDSINTAVGRPTSQRDANEAQAIAVRRRQIADGYTDVDTSMLLTVLAPDEQSLDDAARFGESFMRRHDGHTDSLTMQQWAGLMAALPLGQGGRR